ncbi:MAG: cupin domain-containing protein [Melioribacteraceae bacterium]|nr:cupin domain-containing protein [Melioribacteraceae bacterium]MCF8354291.1 cupin domain-containing protein [Melioribacteraceae bacterium]MCF8394577.1 cupin domain-containing protein [Melioribacteraceae bacterium]MCF8419754.1 cupin domain-containing protein [Melioribacteraceae bacterium]
MNEEAKMLIEKLGLKEHPEGGYFNEVYRSNESIAKISLPERYSGSRNFGTSIYFMLTGNQFSSFHKLKSDETWYFHSGSPIIIYIINEDGMLSTINLGLNITGDEVPQYTINKNSWFAAELKDKNSFGLISCAVFPGFDFDDFQLGRQIELIKLFPQHSELIKKFTNQ